MKRVYKDITGNYIFVTVKIMDKEFLLVYMVRTVIIQSFMLSLRNGSVRSDLKILSLEETGI